MAKKNNSARRHSSPGLYFTDKVVNYATKSLGITSLGVVGETVRGRAFEPTTINDWGEYIYNFGGTSTEKFRGSQYPKYELPYIAESYLEESHNLKVVRVLGLSGVNAGPAWVVTASSEDSEYDDMVVMVLRSRGEHKKASFVQEANPAEGICEDQYEYDGIHYYAADVTLTPSASLNLDQNCNPGYSQTAHQFTVNPLNYGTFTLEVKLNDGAVTPNYVYYSVTLNPTDKNYVYNVIGGDPENGDAEIYVEELYDVALRQLVNEGKITAINENIVSYPNVNIVPAYEDVYDLLTDPLPTANMVGRRYLYSSTESTDDEGNPIEVRVSNDNGVTWQDPSDGVNGTIYTVVMYVSAETGKRSYFYGSYSGGSPTPTQYQYMNRLQAPSGFSPVFPCEATGGAVQNVFVTVPEATENSPQYIATGLGMFKIIDALNIADFSDGTKNLCEISAKIGTVNGLDAIAIEYSTSDALGTIKFSISYDNSRLGQQMTEINNYKVILRLADITGWNSSTMTDASLFDVRYSPKYYEKIVTDSQNTGFESDPSRGVASSESLSTYNASTDIVNGKFTNCVRVVSEDSYYINTTVNGVQDVYPITLDFNNYKEQYRWASSPWIVSEIKGSANNVELNKLFRFHTISDGSNATTEVKISIENIDPATGRFDVVIRDYYDSDLSVNAYEKFLSCDLVPGSPNYIALKIGSTDGTYNSKSRYVTVEVIENDTTKISIPAGFLGYPVRDYSGLAVGSVVGSAVAPYFRYNTNIDDEIKAKKQYFGVSDLVGIDDDIFKYKGVEAYDGNPNGLTPCFHLDSRILNYNDSTVSSIQQTVSVDGVTGYKWVTVGRNNTLQHNKIEPRITSETSVIGTIYEDKAYRKFTVAMYGGWDGWDYYRTVRSNGDEYRYKEYKGAIDVNSGYGTMFSVYRNPESFGFESGDKVITSDYYAYLAGVKLLGNPKAITVNVLATPGIDYVNNKALVDEVIDVVEEDRGDVVYVITTPDKPSGAGDTDDEMYTAQDAVYNLEDSDIDSNYCCTYYPWVKYWDGTNNQYIYLPLTRDVVRSIAYTDNVKFSWYANAGWNRGNIAEGAKPKKRLTLSEQDTLYDGRINFVNSFAEEGNKIWGDKNLQIEDNLLNRISKRRLLLRIRTMLQNACIGLIFDPNDPTMGQTVRSAVAKVLDDVKTGRGITDYKIEIDDSVETRDQLGLYVTYHIKPIQSLEWIEFTSVLTPEGMDWA